MFVWLVCVDYGVCCGGDFVVGLGCVWCVVVIGVLVVWCVDLLLLLV